MTSNGKFYGPYESIEQMFEDLRREYQAKPWHYKTRMWFKRKWKTYMVPAPHMKVKWFIQRGRRGWADRDTWSLDVYIATMLRDTLPYLAEHGHGYPGEGTEWDTSEKWEAYVKDLGQRIGTWLEEDRWFDDDAYDITSAAVAEFGKNLGRFWD
jgi:hypothetical protein